VQARALTFEMLRAADLDHIEIRRPAKQSWQHILRPGALGLPRASRIVQHNVRSEECGAAGAAELQRLEEFSVGGRRIEDERQAANSAIAAPARLLCVPRAFRVAPVHARLARG
jgi:hypothetical protein